MQKNKIKNMYKNYLAVKETNSKKWSESFFCNFFKKKDSFFLFEKNLPEGYLVARKISDEYEIISLATDINFRRKGIASYLIKRLIRKAKKNKIKKIILEVQHNNSPAIEMYKKFDFFSIGIRKNYYKTSSGYHNALVMMRLIN